MKKFLRMAVLFIVLSALLVPSLIHATPDIIGICNLANGDQRTGTFELKGIILNDGQITRVAVKTGDGPWENATGVDNFSYIIDTRQIVLSYDNNGSPVKGPFYGALNVTVGAFNAAGDQLAQKAFTVTIIPEKPYSDIMSGVYSQPINVILKAAPELNIYFTTDGTDPKTNGINYSGAIYVGQNTILKAVTKNSNNQYSEMTSLDFKISSANPPWFQVQYYEDQALSRPISNPAYLKAGTYYLKIVSDRRYNNGPFLTIDVPGYVNDVPHVLVNSVSDCVYRYTRVVNNDSYATGNNQETISIEGTDSNWNPVYSTIPLNINAKAAFPDTQPPTRGSISITGGNLVTNNPAPMFSINSGGASWMRFALTESRLGYAPWVKYSDTYDEFDISGGGNGNKTIWVEFKDQAGNIQTQHASTTVLYDSTDLAFNAEYFRDPQFVDSLGRHPYLKAGTYYVKITSNQELTYCPSIQIDAEGSNNDVVNGLTTMINPRIFYYTRTIVNDAAATGSISEQFVIQGIAPANADSRSAFTDTQAPESPVVSGLATTENLRPPWSWNTISDAIQYRYSFSENSGWIETTETSFTPDVNLTAGNYTLYVEARDKAGNWSESGSCATTVLMVPKISIKQGTTAIANGTGSFNYGNVSVFSNIKTSFTVENTGTADLNLTANPLVQMTGEDAASFNLTTLPSAAVSPDGSTTFEVAFSPTGPGVKTATVTIANNDDDQNPYTFTITGTGIIESATLDSWTVGNITTAGEVKTYSVATTPGKFYVINWDDSYQGSWHYSADVKVTAYQQDLETCYFSNIDSGYTTAQLIMAHDNVVYVKVTGNYDYSTGNFALKVGEIKPLTLDSWSSGNITSVSGEKIYSFHTIAGNSYSISWDDSQEGSGAYSGDVMVSAYRQDYSTAYFNYVESGYLSPRIITAQDDLVYIKVVQSQSSTTGSFGLKAAFAKPVINIKQETTDIPNETGSCQFGNISLLASKESVFTIQNNGIGNLNLTGTPKVQVTGADASDFCVTALPSSPVIPGNSTTFKVKFTPTSAGTKTATVSVTSNDPAINSYTFTVTGTGTIDGTLPLGNWVEGTITDKMVYAIQVTPGQRYGIAWKDSSENYSYQSDILVSAYRKNLTTSYFAGESSGYSQPQIITAQDDLIYLEVRCWVNPGTFAIKAAIDKPVLQVIQNTTKIPNGTGSYDFGNLSVFSNRHAVFTIHNDGTSNLNITDPKIQVIGADAASFEVSTTASLNSPITPNFNGVFWVFFKPTNLGAKTATIRITSDDADANPFTFTVTGTATVESLPFGVWTEGNLLDTDYGVAQTYCFNAVIGRQYAITMDGDGCSGKYTLNGKVTVYRSDLTTTYFDDFDGYLYTEPKIITAADDIIYLKVYGVHATMNWGSFALKVASLQPVINAQQGANDIPKGSGSYNFGTVSVFSKNSTTFTIQNKGVIDLHLTSTPIIAVTGTDAACFQVTTQPIYSRITPNSSSSFIINFTPDGTGTKTATVSIANDADSSPYTFTVTGEGAVQSVNLNDWTSGTFSGPNDVKTYCFNAVIGKEYTIKWDDDYQGSGNMTGNITVSALRQDLSTTYFKDVDTGYSTPQYIIAQDSIVYIKVAEYPHCAGSYALQITPSIPVINVKQGTTNISNGNWSYDFGNTVNTATFTIENPGNGPLYLGDTPKIRISGADASSFKVTADPAATVMPNGNTTFSIKFDPTSSGPKTATVSIASSDPETDSFTFAITGTGVLGELALNTWTNGSISLAGEEKTYYFDTTPGKSYAITWDDSSQGSGSYTGNIKVSAYHQDLSTSYFWDIDSGYSTPKTIIAQEGIVYLKVTGLNATSTGSFALKAIWNKPKLSMKQGSAVIPSGTGSFDFGTSITTATFDIQNTGVGPLNLTGNPVVKLSGANAAYFSVVTQPAAFVAANSSTSFTVKFNPNGSGIRTATVSISSDDENSPYTFTITGTGTIPTLTLGNWIPKNIINAGEVRTYYFEATPGKTYNIAWDDSYQGSKTYTCDVKVAAYRQDLTATYFGYLDSGYNTPQTITALDNIVYIKVAGYNNTSTGSFALKITPSEPTIGVKQGSTNIPNGTGSYNFGEIAQSSSSSATFTISNTGTSALSLTDSTKVQLSGTDAACFSVTTQPASPVAVNGTTTFIVRFTPADTGVKTATVSIASNDSKNNPYTFTVTGTGATVTAEAITLNTWLPKSITTAGTIKYYSFAATPGKTYSIAWDDYYQGTSSYTCDINVAAYQQNLTTAYFGDTDSGYTVPKTITALENTVYIRVSGYYSNSIGSFALKVVEN